MHRPDEHLRSLDSVSVMLVFGLWHSWLRSSLVLREGLQPGPLCSYAACQFHASMRQVAGETIIADDGLHHDYDRSFQSDHVGSDSCYSTCVPSTFDGCDCDHVAEWIAAMLAHSAARRSTKGVKCTHQSCCIGQHL